jgi:LPS sulfotransferase NodH
MLWVSGEHHKSSHFNHRLQRDRGGSFENQQKKIEEILVVFIDSNTFWTHWFSLHGVKTLA